MRALRRPVRVTICVNDLHVKLSAIAFSLTSVGIEDDLNVIFIEGIFDLSDYHAAFVSCIRANDHNIDWYI